FRSSRTRSYDRRRSRHRQLRVSLMSRSLICSVFAALILGPAMQAASLGDGGQDAATKLKPPSPAEAAQNKQPARPIDKPQSGKDKKSAHARATDAPPAKGSTAQSGKSVSFMRDVAPVLVENCVACHNPRKSESKYVMTTFAQLAKGGQQGEGITLEPGEPDESNLIELIRPGGQPRMPYKQDPLPAEKIATIERWVAEGAKYDGGSPGEDWTILLRKMQVITIPAAYPVTIPITALEFSRDGSTIAASGYHELTLWKTADGALDRRVTGLAERVYDIAYSG